MSKTRKALLIGAGIYVGVSRAPDRHLRRHAAQEQRVPDPERVQAGRLGPASACSASTARFSYLFISADPDRRDDDLDRPANADRPNRVQTAVEVLYSLMRDNITRGTCPTRWRARWFPFIGTLFLFIWFCNLIGYLPLPTNSEEKFNLFGAHIPSFALYAATANISVPLVLALVVFVAFIIGRNQDSGSDRLPEEPDPGGVHGPMLLLIFPIEVISTLMRLLSLTIRLLANIFAGHMIILFMAGGLAVILGLQALGWFTHPIRDPRSTCSSWAWWPRCRRSSSRPSPPSTSAARPPTTEHEKESADARFLPTILIAAACRDHAGARDRGRRRPRRGRRRRRHRHDLRQGDRVGDPPAGDARRDHRDPVAGLRADRGDASSTAWSAASSPSSSRPMDRRHRCATRLERLVPDHSRTSG